MNFLNVHIIQVFPFSNLNRDDAGSPKSVQFGGVNRARISSQSLKRAARVTFEAHASGERTLRSKLILPQVMEEVTAQAQLLNITLSGEQRLSIEKLAKEKIDRLTSKEKKKAAGGGDKSDKQSEDRNQDTADEGPKATLVWLAEGELQEFALELVRTATPDTELLNTKTTRSLSIAGFGRMFANRPEVQIEAAIQVAHAFTTHEATTEIDYFTAVDDLREKFEKDMGSGHLDIGEYTSGVFYRYFNIDKNELKRNWKQGDAELSKVALREFFQSLLFALPTGKANSTAPQTLPLMILAEEATQPVSFAGAFERPVKPQIGGGFASQSVTEFENHHTAAKSVAPELFGKSLGVATTPGHSGQTVSDLLDYCVNWVLEE